MFSPVHLVHSHHLDSLAGDHDDIFHNLLKIPLLTHNANLFVSHSFKDANISIHDKKQRSPLCMSKSGSRVAIAHIISIIPYQPSAHRWHSFTKLLGPATSPVLKSGTDLPSASLAHSIVFLEHIFGDPKYRRGKAGLPNIRPGSEIGDQQPKNSKWRNNQGLLKISLERQSHCSSPRPQASYEH